MRILYDRIGRNIQEARIARGLTQSRVAAGLGITPTHYSNLETGKKRIQLESLLRLLEILNISLNELLREAIQGGPAQPFAGEVKAEYPEALARFVGELEAQTPEIQRLVVDVGSRIIKG